MDPTDHFLPRAYMTSSFGICFLNKSINNYSFAKESKCAIAGHLIPIPYIGIRPPLQRFETHHSETNGVAINQDFQNEVHKDMGEDFVIGKRHDVSQELGKIVQIACQVDKTNL